MTGMSVHIEGAHAADAARDGETRLDALRAGCTTAKALALFDDLPTVRVDEITTGRWRGEELRTGHPFDGRLAAAGWYGKQFDDRGSAHPLLFKGPNGRIFPVDPRRIPISLAGRVPIGIAQVGRKLLNVAEPALRARGPGARLRNLEHRGKVSAAMIYDDLPIVDVFRRVSEHSLLGVMDFRSMPVPYFFILYRD